MKKVIIVGTIGNILEWYDFALYGHFAELISQNFFPTGDPTIALLATYGAFAAGFIMRPFGGMIFGYIGDKYGRRTSLAFSIFMMAIPTVCIGLLPTYDSIGILAPILLTLIRLLQGASVGGAFSGCIAFLVEHSPPGKRGLIGSISMAGLSGGMLFGSLVATAVYYFMPEAEFNSWGWRVPFLLGVFLAVIGVYIKVGIEESPIYLEAKKRKNISSQPIKEVFTHYRTELLLAVGIYLTVTVPFYILTIFIKSYMCKNLGYSYADALKVNLISLAVATSSMPIGAWFSDKFGRKPVMKYTTILILLLIYPIFLILKSYGVQEAIASQLLFAALVGFYMGPIPATLVELFPTRVRYTGVAISYNFSAAAFGGTAPLIATWLTSKSEYPSEILASYIIAFLLMTLYTLKYYQDTYKKELI